MSSCLEKILLCSPSPYTALEKLREEFKADNESLAQSEAISILSLVDDLPKDDEDVGNHKKATEQNGNANRANNGNAQV